MMIAKLFPRIPIISTMGINKLSYHFSNKSEIPGGLDQTRAAKFYRDSIKKVNVKASSGRGIFTDFALKRVVSLANASDLEIMFEAYYNYLGHFTIMSNSVVDELLLKTISLARRDPEIEDVAIEKVLQVLNHHDFLRYFPHYLVTQGCARFIVERKNQKFNDLITVLKEKLLIKIDQQTLKLLFGICQQWSHFVRLVKLGAYRSNRNIIQSLSKEELLKMIAVKLRGYNEISLIKPNKDFEHFLQQFETPSLELAIVLLITEGKLDKAAETFAALPKGTNGQEFQKVILKLQQSDSEIDLQGKLESCLSSKSYKAIFG